MTRAGDIAQVLAVAGFVVSGIAYAFLAERPDRASPVPMALRPSDPLASDPFDLARLYLQPENIVMVLLLLALWALLALEAVGNALEPYRVRGGVAAPLIASLLAGTIWPWLAGLAQWASGGLAIAMMLFALLAVRRMVGNSRPAIGFLAGWCTGTAIAVMAGMIAAGLGLRVSEAAALAILPGVLIAALVQGRIGSSISFTIALIWVYCGLALTMIGINPMAALAAILGIAVLTAVLIRAAS